jgi:hypothetical protein
VELIDIEKLTRFIGIPMEITIHDTEGTDQAPVVKKNIKKIQLCPDHTHIRFYFDDVYFLAVPLSSEVSETENEWSAFNHESGLQYTLKKVQVFS